MAQTLAGTLLAFHVAEGFMALSRALTGPNKHKKHSYKASGCQDNPLKDHQAASKVKQT